MSGDVRMPGALRVGLIVLGLPQLAIGVWALASTRGWFDTFPGGGQHWLGAYGPYNAHLAIDVGASFAAIGVILLIAAWTLNRLVVIVALVGYLVYDLPHLVYHLGADHRLSTSGHIESDVSLGLSVLLALALLPLTRRPTSAPEASPDPTSAAQ
jgi:hypothetical protein